MDNAPVVHNEQRTRFEIALNGKLAVTEYRRTDKQTLEFHHTLVPPELRGQGLAAQVVKAGLDYARANNLRVVPTCSYVASYIERHPQYQDLLAPGIR